MSALRSTVTMCLVVAWFIGVETVRNGWPDRSGGWWVVYLAGFVVIGVGMYYVDKAIAARRERRGDG